MSVEEHIAIWRMSYSTKNKEHIGLNESPVQVTISSISTDVLTDPLNPLSTVPTAED
jgi:hypothetical protein